MKGAGAKLKVKVQNFCEQEIETRMSMDSTEQQEPKRRGGPFRFFGEVRAEGRKVTWATRQEVTVSTIMVMVMCVAAAFFFFLVDSVVGGLVRWLLSLNSGA
jgi:preprotein translocase subunit SecE